MQEAGMPSPSYDELVEALHNLLSQLEGVGIYIEGVDEGQWAGTEGLSFAEASAVLAKATGLPIATGCQWPLFCEEFANPK